MNAVTFWGLQSRPKPKVVRISYPKSDPLLSSLMQQASCKWMVWCSRWSWCLRRRRMAALRRRSLQRSPHPITTTAVRMPHGWTRQLCWRGLTRSCGHMSRRLLKTSSLSSSSTIGGLIDCGHLKRLWSWLWRSGYSVGFGGDMGKWR